MTVSNYEFGERVVVTLSHIQQEGAVYLIGYGTYVSDEVPDEIAVGELSEKCRKEKTLVPKIMLDDGQIVWATEVFWGSAKQFQSLIDVKAVIHCDLDQERKKAVDSLVTHFGNGNKEPDMESILAAAKAKAKQLPQS